MRTVSFVVIALAVLPGAAHAFHEVASFGRTANSGGGAGYYFTGSKRFKGYDCTMCHTGAEGRIEVEVTSTPDLSSGVYEPNSSYEFRVRLIGEHRGLESAFNPNTFMLEIVDDEGELGGSFLGGDERPDGGRIVAAEGFGEGETEWTFLWFSPAEDPPPLNFHIALVDGDGASDPVERRIDPLNDDVAVATMRFCPPDVSCAELGEPELEPSAVGCTLGGDSAGLLVLLAFLPLLARRRRAS